MSDLKPFFEPSSVAVIGASSNTSKLGYAVLKNLHEGGYSKRGKIYPINPGAEEILGYPAFALRPGGARPDRPGSHCHTRTRMFPTALRECGAERHPSRHRDQRRLPRGRPRRPGARAGADRNRPPVSYPPGRPELPGHHRYLHAPQRLFCRRHAAQRPNGFMSQSGALGTAVLDIALAGRLGLSKFVSLGNKADVSEIDLLKAWQDDPDNPCHPDLQRRHLPNGQEFIEVSPGSFPPQAHRRHQIWGNPIGLARRFIAYRFFSRLRAGLPGCLPASRGAALTRCHGIAVRHCPGDWLPAAAPERRPESRSSPMPVGRVSWQPMPWSTPDCPWRASKLETHPGSGAVPARRGQRGQSRGRPR
jgi:hypothetical protein